MGLEHIGIYIVAASALLLPFTIGLLVSGVLALRASDKVNEYLGTTESFLGFCAFVIVGLVSWFFYGAALYLLGVLF